MPVGKQVSFDVTIKIIRKHKIKRFIKKIKKYFNEIIKGK